MYLIVPLSVGLNVVLGVDPNANLNLPNLGTFGPSPKILVLPAGACQMPDQVSGQIVVAVLCASLRI